MCREKVQRPEVAASVGRPVVPSGQEVFLPGVWGEMGMNTNLGVIGRQIVGGALSPDGVSQMPGIPGIMWREG